MNSFRFYIISTIIVIGFLSLIEATKTEPVDWKPSFNSEHKKPWGTYILYKELPRYFPGSTIKNINRTPYEELKNISYKSFNGNITYIFINNFFDPDDESLGALLEFVHEGGTVFISARNISTLSDSLKVNYGMYLQKDFIADTLPKKVHLSPPLSSDFYFKKGFLQTFIASFPSGQTEVLGTHDFEEKEFINYVRVKYGEGYFYLHTQPYLFTNYHMLKYNHEQYVAGALSFLPGEILWWDNKNKYDTGEIQHPLRFILTQPALKWAWKIGLWTLVLFALFTAKRKQRIIPIIPPKQNTSVEFARTIGDLYYRKGSSKDIIKHQINLFFDSIRQKYLLDPLQKENNFYKKLHQKSGVPREVIEKLFNYIDFVQKKKQPEEINLITLNKLLNEFNNESY